MMKNICKRRVETRWVPIIDCSYHYMLTLRFDSIRSLIEVGRCCLFVVLSPSSKTHVNVLCYEFMTMFVFTIMLSKYLQISFYRLLDTLSLTRAGCDSWTDDDAWTQSKYVMQSFEKNPDWQMLEISRGESSLQSLRLTPHLQTTKTVRYGQSFMIFETKDLARSDSVHLCIRQ